MIEDLDWETRALLAEEQMMQLYLVLVAAVAGAGGRIVIHQHDLYNLPSLQLHHYHRPESGAQVFELVKKPLMN